LLHTREAGQHYAFLGAFASSAAGRHFPPDLSLKVGHARIGFDSDLEARAAKKIANIL